MSRVSRPSHGSHQTSLLDIDPGRFRYSAWRNISIGIWASQATAEAAERVLRISKHLAKLHPGGHSNIVFVLDGAPAPTPEANEVFAKIHDSKVSDLACMAIVVEGGGFWASRIRSSITGVRLASPGAIQLRINDTIQDVLEWFPAEHFRRTGVAVTASELKAVLLATRELGTHDNGELPQVKR